MMVAVIRGEVCKVLFKSSSGQLVSRAQNAFSFSSPFLCSRYSSASASAARPQLSSSYNPRTQVPPLSVGEGPSSLRAGCVKERLLVAAGRRRSAVFVAGFASAGAAGRREVAVSAVTMTAGLEVAEKMDPVQQRLMFDDECILVDEKDNVVGHDSKYNCHLMEKIEAENLLHRAFSVFLFNSKNELLLQKRSATKVTFPLVWTNTCCSHPLYRDSELIKENHLGVRNAAQRKLFDELGIKAPDAPVDNFTCLGRILYKAASDGKWGEHELDYLIFMKRDVTVEPNPEEVADIMYVTREQLQGLVQKAKAGEDGVKLSPWFQLVVENFLYDWWKRLEEGTLAEVADMETIHKLL